MIKLSESQINQIISLETGLTSPIKDEMAIPSYTHINPLIRWLMWRRLQMVIEPNIDQNSSVLDFGCGLGLLFPSLTSLCNNVYAIDLYPHYAKAFSKAKNYNVSFIENLNDLEDHSMDIVIAADVLEHIEDLESYISIFSRKIKLGGSLVVSGPTENLIYNIGRIVAGWGDKGDYHHTDIFAIRLKILQQGFIQVTRRLLPFTLPPHLFQVYRFNNNGE